MSCNLLVVLSREQHVGCACKSLPQAEAGQTFEGGRPRAVHIARTDAGSCHRKAAAIHWRGQQKHIAAGKWGLPVPVAGCHPEGKL